MTRGQALLILHISAPQQPQTIKSQPVCSATCGLPSGKSHLITCLSKCGVIFTLHVWRDKIRKMAASIPLAGKEVTAGQKMPGPAPTFGSQSNQRVCGYY